MGTRYQFECQKCGYGVVVSGGDDVGMISRTTTIFCNDCNELFDAVTSEEPWNHQSSTQRDPVCPINTNHLVERWEHPGLCPRCNEQFMRTDQMILWD